MTESSFRAAPNPQHALVALGVIVVVLTGCLFPPPEVSMERDDPDPTATPTTTPTTTLPPDPPVRRGEQTFGGTIDQGASVTGPGSGLPDGTERHTLDLPGRVEEIRIELGWDTDRGQDLDLEMTLQKGGRDVWSATVADGQSGDPDEPITRTYTPADIPSLATEAQGAMHFDISTKASVDTPYELFIEWWYVPTD